jgi:hypothetical protein
MNARRRVPLRRGPGITLALMALIASHLAARATSAAAIPYTTEGWINLSTASQGQSSTRSSPGQSPPIEFQGVPSGTFDGVHPFSLGQFVIPQGRSSDATIDNAQVYINFDLPSLRRFDPGPAPSLANFGTLYEGSFSVFGLLNGNIISGVPHLTFTISQVSPVDGQAHIPEELIQSVLPFSLDRLNIARTITLDSSGGGGAGLPLMAQVVPEPTTMILFLTAIVGFAVRGRFGRRS